MTGPTGRAEGAAQALRTRILSGLPAGTLLREEAVAAELGVSRNSLREAFKLLTAEGLVVAERNRGVSVASISVDRVSEIYAIRRLIEPAAIYGTLRAPTTRLRSIGTVVDEIEEAAVQQRWNDVGTLSLRFHQHLVAVLDNSTLDIFFQRLFAQLRLGWGAGRDEYEFQARWAARDRALFERILAGQAEEAVSMLNRYLDEAEHQTLGALRLKQQHGSEVGI